MSSIAALDRLSTTSRRSVGRAKFLWVVTGAVIVVAALSLPAFRTDVSINSLLATLTPILLIATGQGLVVMSGGIDLSVGAIAGLATVVLSLSPLLPGGTAMALVLVVAVGTLAGLINGLGVVAGINPLLMTFALAGVIQGFALLLQDLPGAGIPIGLLDVLGASLGPVPVLALAALVILVLSWLWLGETRSGQVIQAAGYDARIATRLSLPVRRSKLTVYALSGLFSSLGGLAIVTRTYTADALIGTSSIIDSIAAVLVAGIVISGGVGSLLSIFPAALMIAVVGQVITLTGTNPQYQTIFKGVLLVAALGIYRLTAGELPFRLRRAADPTQSTNGAA